MRAFDHTRRDGVRRLFAKAGGPDKGSLERLFANVLALKLARAVPVVLVSWLLVLVFVSDATTRTAIFVLTSALLLESLSKTAADRPAPGRRAFG